MNHPAFEETTISVDVSHEPHPDASAAWSKTVETLFIVEEIINGLEESKHEGGPFHEPFDDDYLDVLIDTYQTGEKLAERDDLDEVRKNMSRLGPDMLEEVEETIGYVAPHFEIDLDLPDATAGGA